MSKQTDTEMEEIVSKIYRKNINVTEMASLEKDAKKDYEYIKLEQKIEFSFIIVLDFLSIVCAIFSPAIMIVVSVLINIGFIIYIRQSIIKNKKITYETILEKKCFKFEEKLKEDKYRIYRQLEKKAIELERLKREEEKQRIKAEHDAWVLKENKKRELKELLKEIQFSEVKDIDELFNNWENNKKGGE